MLAAVTSIEFRGARKLLEVAGRALPTVAFCILIMSTNNITFAVEAPSGTFENTACVGCHEKRDSELVRAWRASTHSKGKKVANCVACHGNSHNDATASARRNRTCIECHGGKNDPVVHSYTTSKHGVIYTLEKREWNWSLPLERANYRTPGCSYCHMHQGNHNVRAGVRSRIMEATIETKVQDNMRAACQDCHAPRYVTSLFDNGEAMLNIGRMKVREAANLLQRARIEFSSEQLLAVEQQFKKMQSRHLNNVLLGVGHQSPDYQWWHGHPALDGDLLRIKGGIAGLKRKRTLTKGISSEATEPTDQ